MPRGRGSRCAWPARADTRRRAGCARRRSRLARGIGWAGRRPREEYSEHMFGHWVRVIAIGAVVAAVLAGPSAAAAQARTIFVRSAQGFEAAAAALRQT